jgi:hypothetical protein
MSWACGMPKDEIPWTLNAQTNVTTRIARSLSKKKKTRTARKTRNLLVAREAVINLKRNKSSTVFYIARWKKKIYELILS